jgi:hypothetical protein
MSGPEEMMPVTLRQSAVICGGRAGKGGGRRAGKGVQGRRGYRGKGSRVREEGAACLRDAGELIHDGADEVRAAVAAPRSLVHKRAHIIRVLAVWLEARRREGVRPCDGVGCEHADGAHREAGRVTVEPQDVLAS